MFGSCDSESGRQAPARNAGRGWEPPPCYLRRTFPRTALLVFSSTIEGWFLRVIAFWSFHRDLAIFLLSFIQLPLWSLFFPMPRPALHHRLVMHVERAETPTRFPPHETHFDVSQGCPPARAWERARTSVSRPGSPLPRRKPTFMKVYGGT